MSDSKPLHEFVASVEATIVHENNVVSAWRNSQSLEDVNAARKGRRRLLERVSLSRLAAKLVLVGSGESIANAQNRCAEILSLCQQMQSWDARLRSDMDAALYAGARWGQLQGPLAYQLEQLEARLENNSIEPLMERLHYLRQRMEDCEKVGSLVKPDAETTLTLDERALALFFANRNRTKKVIAQLLSVPTQSICPARCPQLDKAMKAWRDANAGPRARGCKDQDGNLEAWAEDE